MKLHVSKYGKCVLTPKVELYLDWHRETHFTSDSVLTTTGNPDMRVFTDQGRSFPWPEFPYPK